jgi:hypothetical protein
MYFRQRNPLDAVYRMHKMYRLTKFVARKIAFMPRNGPQQHTACLHNRRKFTGFSWCQNLLSHVYWLTWKI